MYNGLEAREAEDVQNNQKILSAAAQLEANKELNYDSNNM